MCLVCRQCFGEGLNWAGCTLIALLGQENRFQALDFCYHIVKVHEVDSREEVVGGVVSIQCILIIIIFFDGSGAVVMMRLMMLTATTTKTATRTLFQNRTCSCRHHFPDDSYSFNCKIRNSKPELN